MIIQTRYNVGDYVWIMRDNKPTKIQISNVSIEAVGKLQPGSIFLTGDLYLSITYTEIQRKEYGSADEFATYSYPEGECFPSKLCLIDSLKEEGDE